MKLKFLLICLSLFRALSAAEPNESYEWLENPENPQTKEWLKQQQSLFNNYIAETTTNEIKDTLKKLSTYDLYSIPKKINHHYFYTSKQPSEKQHKLYIQNELNESPQVIFDPNTVANIALEHYVVSPNGKYLAYSTSENGSDWLICRVMNINSKLNPEEFVKEDSVEKDFVEKIKFSPIVWSPDSQGFFYSRFDTEKLHSVGYHILGTMQSQDRLVYQDLSDGSVGYTPFISRDNRYLIIDAFNGSSGPNSISLIDLETINSTPVTIIPCDGSNYWFICSNGTKFYFLTNKNADFRKVVYIDINDQKYTQHDFIPEGKFLLEGIAPIGNYFLAVTSENVANKLTVFDDQGKFVNHIPLPSSGKVSLNKITQNAISAGNEIFFSFTNFFQPPTIYHYQLGPKAPKIFKTSNLNVDPDNFVITQVYYDSKDGTKVPMFIAHKKGIQLDRNNPTLLTGYGAYGYIYYPTYSPEQMLWLEKGGVLALANIRGGGELGESWHRQALKENKQNSFDDFIAAAEWLIKSKYTQPNRLAAIGMSSGGLLVAASANQRPDLFKAIVVEAGLLDMLRFHLFTVGRFWISEHGNPDDPSDFAMLSKYSPCHNVKKMETYPSVLVTASQDDDRVVPSHSFKYLAVLQNNHKNKPMYLRLSSNIGHDSSQSADWINERADILAFIYRELLHQ